MKEKHPMTCILFGATGDLAQNKILPALMDLYIKDLLPDDFRIVGFSRKDLTDADYREFVSNALDKKEHGHSEEKISALLERVHYKQGNIDSLEDYQALNTYLGDFDKADLLCSNKLFYLAVPPNLYESVFKNISEAKLIQECIRSETEEGSWSRILVEKPFGSNPEEAKKLDKTLGSLFEEEQIFRIDHYLAKEAVQNIITFRFANAIFEPLWNREHIEKVNIKLYEKNDLETRGNFYDGLGALSDVGQNHVLQMLALVAMEDPKGINSESIRKARLDVLSRIVPFSRKIEDYAYRAQYNGYKNTEGVDSKSHTETYFKLKMGIKNDRWKGVPFYLESGKALNESRVEIEIVFKDKESSVCPIDGICHYNNVLRMNIQPDHEISICFWTKKPGLAFDLEERRFSFDYEKGDVMLPDAYEKVLYDAIKGDQTLFTSTQEVATEWNIISKIKDKWNNINLETYEKGADPADLKALN